MFPRFCRGPVLEGPHHLKQFLGGDQGTVQQESSLVVDIEAKGLNRSASSEP